MLPLKTAALSAFVLLALAGCVGSSDETSGGPGAGAAAKKGHAIFRVSGRDISAQELIGSPAMRQSLRQFLLGDAIKSYCAKQGIKLDESAVEAKLNEQKQGAVMQGHSWDEYLKDNMMTEAEFREALKMQMFYEAMMNSMVKVSDAELKLDWDKEKDMIISAYIMENHLPDSDRAKITFEQTKEFNRKRVVQQKGPAEQSKIFDDLVNTMTLDLSPSFPDPAQAKVLEDLILNNAKTNNKPEEKSKDGGVVLGGKDGEAGGAAAGGQDEGKPAGDGAGTQGGWTGGGATGGDNKGGAASPDDKTSGGGASGGK